MKNPIEIGCLYQRSETGRIETAMNSDMPSPYYALLPTYDEVDKCLPGIYLGKDDLIVILEVFYHTAKGNKLRGKSSFRARVLTNGGIVCFLYSNVNHWLSDWEEAV